MWGWFLNQADADNYFTNERFANSVWNSLNAGQKERAVEYGYNRIYHSPQWNVPDLATATAAELIVLRIIGGEIANYVALHLQDEDSRKGLQAQAVIKAGIVKEDYYAEWLDKLPVPANVEDLLKQWKTAHALMITDIDRDEDYCVNTPDVVDCD